MIIQYKSNTHNVCTLIPITYENNPYPYEHFLRPSQQILEIDEVTIDVSISIGTRPTTKSGTPLNPKIVAFTRSQTLDLRCY